MNPARATTATAVLLFTAGSLLTATAASASAAVSCASPVYKRQFYANTTFSGTPKKTDCDSVIDQNWGTGAPASGLPKDNFGVRWTVTRDFGSGGPFALPVESRDGIRVYLDGARKVDLWKNVSTTQKKTGNITVPSGKHTLRVDFVNWTGAANVKFAYQPRTSADADTVKPLVPTGTAVAYDGASGQAKVTWSRNKEMDLAGYRVYRRLKGTSFGSRPLATTTGTSYTDATLPRTGETYYYEVRAYDKAGNESTGTADQPVTTVDTTAPGAPQGLTATSTKAANSLSWQATSGAASYEVYRAADAGGTYERIGTVTSPSYTDSTAAADVPLAYKVRALDPAGNASAYSAVVWATRDTVAPLPPQNLTVVSQDEGGVTLTWRSGGSDGTKYVVHRAESQYDELVRLGETSTLTYRDTTGEAGLPYQYYVTAVDAAGNESRRVMTTATRPVGPSSAPRAPTWGFAGVVDDRLMLEWNQGGEVPVAEYTVYRSRTTPVDTTDPANFFGTYSGKRLETPVADDEKDYYYALVATSPNGVRSTPSSSVLPSVSEAPLPYPPQVDEVFAGDSYARLTWLTPPTSPGQPSILGYRVYRSTSPGVTKDNSVVSPLVRDLTEYTDPGLANGTTYYYAVATVDVQGLEGPLSAEVSVTPHA
ncbi:PA14 domain-containing protein [Streptomyces bluensis]|uniref:PA14 domain-containing protein n=1 Tax=Streptomyces bluensis TaxID=33897 RepID=UPI001672DE63|nr:fibronectin type III domain-containing protein [Streptomyces bluensis]GGZ90198.1 hypothetical protein GCM10010344_67200 [Streptomyces bluensis]